ncbi:MAG: FAD binding domain-containing protein [Sphaerochaetaceae bacterium]
MVESCYIPKDLKEALRIRKETQARPLAGGTDLMVVHRRGTGVVPSFPWPVMIVSRLPQLQGIFTDGNEIVIRSLVTCSEIEKNDDVPYQVRKAASLMGAHSLRNLATIGGNICNASPKGDLPVPLIMMDAKVVLLSATGKRILPLDEFITGPKKTALHSDEILTEIRIPVPTVPYSHIWYRKIGTRKANAISKLSMSAAITFSQERIVTDFRSANGASGPKVARSREVEQILIGTHAREIANKIPEILSAYDAILSPHAMPEYRRSSTRRMLHYFLTKAASEDCERIII